MHTISIPQSNINLYIPEDLSQCNAEQYIEMCSLIFRHHNGEITLDDFKIQGFYKLAGLKPPKKEAVTEYEKEQELLKFDNIARASNLLESFFEENDGQKTIKQYYTHNPVPRFKPLFKTLYGPADSFLNMTFGEYRDALRLFHDFRATAEIHLLVLLTAIFYRQKKPFNFIQKHLANYDGDGRIPYQSNYLDANAKNLKYAPMGFIYGFYLFFASFHKYLVQAKLMWGGKEIDLSILFESDKSESNESNQSMPGIGMDSIAFTMAESGAFGNLKEVDNTNFWVIMIRMYDSRRADLELKKRQDNATNK